MRLDVEDAPLAVVALVHGGVLAPAPAPEEVGLLALAVGAALLAVGSPAVLGGTLVLAANGTNLHRRDSTVVGVVAALVHPQHNHLAHDWELLVDDRSMRRKAIAKF